MSNRPLTKTEWLTSLEKLWETAQQPQKWVGLTDEQRQCLVTDWFDEDWAVKKALWLLDDYEAKLQERNNG